MPMHQLLNVPEAMAYWATTAGRTLEPADAVKAFGWTAEYKAPARWFNWLQNLFCQWTRVAGKQAVANWFDNDTPAGAINARGIIWHPVIEKWLMSRNTNANVCLSDSGHNWQVTVGALSAAPTDNVIGIDSTRYLLGTANQIDYSTNGVAWNTELTATIGGTAGSTILAIGTAYPTDSRTMAVRAGSEVRIAATGIGGGWVGPTTPPAATVTPLRIQFIGGQSWIYLAASAVLQAGVLEISNDDGDTWTASAAAIPEIATNTVYRDMDYNPDSGRIVIVGGNPVTGPKAFYTDDLGASWSTATQDAPRDIGNLNTVRCCGGGLWVACGDYVATRLGRPHVRVSVDDGETWQLAQGMTAGSMTTSDFWFAGCDGRKVVIAGTNADNLFSLQSG